MKVAIAGKGGVGKTVVAGGIAIALARAGSTTIAIDADPTPNLALSLGLSRHEAEAIRPVCDNADLIRDKTGTGYPGVYSLNFTVDDIVRKYAVPTPAGVGLLVMGAIQSMDAGCSCAASSVIRRLVRHLILERDEAVVLDMEAGLEHLGRGTAEGVDCLIVVSDANAKSLDTAAKIAAMARDFGIPLTLLIGNRVRNPEEQAVIGAFAERHGLDVAGYVPYDPAVFSAGISGESLLSLEGAPALEAIGTIGIALIDRLRSGGTGERKGMGRGMNR